MQSQQNNQEVTRVVRVAKALIALSWLIVVLAVIAAGAGLLWAGGDGPYAFTTLRGESAEIYGRGLYQYDSLLIGAGFRGADAVVLFLAVPLLLYAITRYQRGSLKGAFLLMGTLSYFLYNYASMALGAAYNNLFLVYTALFSASLFAFVLAFMAIDLEDLSAHVKSDMPHTSIAIFMFATGLVFLIVWLVLDIALPLSQGAPPPTLASYTTPITHVLDLGILMPVAFLAGILLLRRAPLGYLLACTMLVLGGFVVGASVPAATVSQLVAGYEFTAGQFIAFVGSFVVLGVIAGWLVVLFLHNVVDTTEANTNQSQPRQPIQGLGHT